MHSMSQQMLFRLDSVYKKYVPGTLFGSHGNQLNLNSVRKLLISATVQRNRFTPMSYLKYIARDFHRSLGNLEIESESSHTSSNILSDTSVGVIPLAEDLAGAKTRNAERSDVKEKTELIPLSRFIKEKKFLSLQMDQLKKGLQALEGGVLQFSYRLIQNRTKR